MISERVGKISQGLPTCAFVKNVFQVTEFSLKINGSVDIQEHSKLITKLILCQTVNEDEEQSKLGLSFKQLSS